MVENPMAERRDISGILTTIQVDVAVIKEKAVKNEEGIARVEGSIARIQERMADALFREEYERRHKALEDLAKTALAEAQSAKQRAEAVAKDQIDQRTRFRWIIGTSIAAIATIAFVVELFLHYRP